MSTEVVAHSSLWTRGRFWVIAGVAVAVVVIILMLVRGIADVAGRPFAADDAGPAGSRALAHVLQGRGVDVRIVDTLTEATSAVGDGQGATLLLIDADGLLDTSQLRRAGALAESTVVVSPSFEALEALATGVRSGGAPKHDSLDARCSLRPATQAGSITAGTRTLSSPDDTWTGCFPDGGNRYGVLQAMDGGRTTTLIADGALLRNDTITGRGDAALALGVLGTQPRLVWYLPTLADVAVAGKPTVAELTPGWVTPVLLLAAAVFFAAAVWRGRRFGPLVVENLPVVVRAGETTEGRARLYARNSARLRAADALRIGAIGRIASQLGLPRSADVDEICLSAACITRTAPDAVRGVLLTDEPTTDAALVALSDRLAALERAVREATSTSAPPPSRRMDP